MKHSYKGQKDFEKIIANFQTSMMNGHSISFSTSFWFCPRAITFEKTKKFTDKLIQESLRREAAYFVHRTMNFLNNFVSC